MQLVSLLASAVSSGACALSQETVLACALFLVVGALLFVGLLLPRLERNKKSTRVGVLLIIGLFAAVYWMWRLACTVPPFELTGQVAFIYGYLAVELITFYGAIGYMWGLRRTLDRRSEADQHQHWYGAKPPDVAILVPTYNESWPILERTIEGAKAQNYTGKVSIWVLDDGNRSWLKDRCLEAGTLYLERTEHKHAKAGNLNNAIAHLAAAADCPPIVAVFDADFIARPGFLTRTIALLYNDKTALVQTPQYYFNADPFQSSFHNGRQWPDSNRFLFGTHLPSQDAFGQSICCGTSFVVRMSALIDIGGVPTESLTEDVLMSVRLRDKGYQVVYLNECLSVGLAPETLEDYLAQRHRWCLGTTQLARVAWRELKGRGWLTRIRAAEGCLRMGYGAAIRLMLLVVPFAYWGLGWVAFERIELLPIFGFPLWILFRGFFSWVSRGACQPVIFDGTELVASPTLVDAFLKGLSGIERRFEVTAKGVRRDTSRVRVSTFLWASTYLVLILAGMIYGAFGRPGAEALVYYVWSTFVVLQMLVVLVPCFQGPRRREEVRFSTDESAVVTWAGGEMSLGVADLGLGGALLDRQLPAGTVECALVLRGMSPIAASVLGQRRTGTVLKFVDEPSARATLLRRIFLSPDYVTPPDEGRLVPMLWSIVATPFRMASEWLRSRLSLGARAV